jgi:Putative methyltransferase
MPSWRAGSGCDAAVVARDWISWHDAYDDRSSPLAIRLALVQAQLSIALALAPPGPIRLVSLCAGQGRDVLGVLPGHPRRDDVTAVLVEYDPHNVAVAAERAAAENLSAVQVREADAGLVSNYADALPADVLLLCGIFGNVSEADIHRTVAASASMCAAGATVLWTRHRRAPDLTREVRSWFAAAGFTEVAFYSPPTGTLIGVGVNRLTQSRGSQLPAERLFSFSSR